MYLIKNVAKSILIGAGAIAPGVSGGAMAIVFGLYEKIISSINNILKNFKKNAWFLIQVGIGAAIGVVAFSSIQLTLIEKYEMPTMFVFAGLVIGTIPVLFKTANKKGYSKNLFIPFLITLIIGVIFSLLDNSSISDNIKETEVILNFKNILYLFLIGVIMSGSLVIPGISGTVLLFLLGVYGLVMNSVASIKDIFTLEIGSKAMILEFLDKMYILIPLALGLLVGTVIFSRLMDYLIKHHYSITYYAILGFVIGSIPELLPKIEFGRTFILSVILFIFALYASLNINRLANK